MSTMAIIPRDTDWDSQDLIDQGIVNQAPETQSRVLHTRTAVFRHQRYMYPAFCQMVRLSADGWKDFTDGERDEMKERGRWSRTQRKSGGQCTFPQEFLPSTQRVSGFALYLQSQGWAAFYGKGVESESTDAPEPEAPDLFTAEHPAGTQIIRITTTYGNDWALATLPQVYWFLIRPRRLGLSKPWRYTRSLGRRYTWPREPGSSPWTTVDDFAPTFALTAGRPFGVYYSVRTGIQIGFQGTIYGTW